MTAVESWYDGSQIIIVFNDTFSGGDFSVVRVNEEIPGDWEYDADPEDPPWAGSVRLNGFGISEPGLLTYDGPPTTAITFRSGLPLVAFSIPIDVL